MACGFVGSFNGVYQIIFEFRSVKMAVLPEFFRRSVVAIGQKSNGSAIRWFATGFVVGRKERETPDMFSLYLITNRHVVLGKNAIVLRFNLDVGNGVSDVTIPLSNTSGGTLYSLHPTDSVDVAACALHAGNITNAHSELSWFELDRHALTLEKMRNSGVDEGSLVYALGFPMGIVLDSIKAPFIRLGCVSRIADAFQGVGDSSYFVDAQTFPGNSGGPVVNKPEPMSIAGTPCNTSANLIGILNAYIPYRDNLISRQTGEVVMQHRENTGLTRVYPVDRILEVVEIERNRYYGTHNLNAVNDRTSVS